MYHLADEEIEYQVPVLEDVRNIQVGRDGQMALVSYDTAPPELWGIKLIPRNNSLIAIARMLFFVFVAFLVLQSLSASRSAHAPLVRYNAFSGQR